MLGCVTPNSSIRERIILKVLSTAPSDSFLKTANTCSLVELKLILSLFSGVAKSAANFAPLSSF